ncbi:hypothetical protein PPSIR1_00680 [Plesiocystis pacifica SIR-1]|uniref:Uncharacterized protein n=1 Tax=Plesiocystis pacifica SIR-1 TaxID=391625 RepID=A6G7J4_9BACT|nr:MYXO-CTERM sorting domain-containing protein [Plesiocystis pacifica]EDM78203.1 hypothetical protein PPSIR1_00680 [Plesiocystis pacifica SIR-1]
MERGQPGPLHRRAGDRRRRGERAFATDYAGDTPSSTSNIYNALWDETDFLGADPIEALDIIVGQGLNTHPMVRVLLAEFIPPPDGVDTNQFWSNIESFADEIDLDAWDDVAFSEALAERVIVPGMHAADLLDTWPYLTRLHTTISPNEMTADPTFHVNEDLPEVSRTVLTDSLIQCGGDRLFDVEFEASADQGGQQLVQICQPSGTAYPDFPDMPRALRVEQVPAMGPPQVVQDNSEAILSAHAEQQAGLVCKSEAGGTGDTGGSEGGTGAGTGSDDGGSEGGTTGGAEGGTGAGGGEEIGGDGSDTGAGLDEQGEVSCGCSSDGQDHSPLGVALGLLVLGLVGGPFAGARRRLTE